MKYTKNNDISSLIFSNLVQLFDFFHANFILFCFCSSFHENSIDAIVHGPASEFHLSHEAGQYSTGSARVHVAHASTASTKRTRAVHRRPQLRRRSFHGLHQKLATYSWVWWTSIAVHEFFSIFRNEIPSQWFALKRKCLETLYFFGFPVYLCGFTIRAKFHLEDDRRKILVYCRNFNVLQKFSRWF